METLHIIAGVCLGVGLAAAVGFRVFLPLLFLSFAGFNDIIPLNESWEWVGSLTAVIVLGIATVIEIAGYYIPWVDNALDTIAVPLATAAGMLVVAATVSDLDPVITWALTIIAGGGTAAAISGTSSAVRLTATATTGGFANPIVSTAETATATVFSVLAIFIPIAAGILVLLLFYFVIRFYKKRRRKV